MRLPAGSEGYSREPRTTFEWCPGFPLEEDHFPSKGLAPFACSSIKPIMIGKIRISFFRSERSGDGLIDDFQIILDILDILFQDLMNFPVVDLPIQMDQEITEPGHPFQPLD